jgi:hyperosmotically inducible protein
MDKRYVKTTVAIVAATSLFMSGGAFAEKSVWDKAKDLTDKAGQLASDTAKKAEKVLEKTGDKVEKMTDKTADKVDKYVDDSTITAKVKKAIADDNLSAGYDISVKTTEGIVTLSGFVISVEQQVRAVKIATDTEGVKAVRDKMNIRVDKKLTVKDFTSDAAITSGIKAKLLAADNLPKFGISVETVNGIVQLSGEVKTQEQADEAERLAKKVKGVLSVKNDLAIAP